jgi:hypothetical protein
MRLCRAVIGNNENAAQLKLLDMYHIPATISCAGDTEIIRFEFCLYTVVQFKGRKPG